MISDDSAPGEPPFTPELDAEILRGLVEDEEELLREMIARGHSPDRVRARASRLGLTDQIARGCRLAGTVPSMRRCLACGHRFLSTGPQRRLCKHCRRQT